MVFDLPMKGGKGRLWLGELPNMDAEPTSTRECTLPCKASQINSMMLAAIDLTLYAGPRSMSGLLGAVFTPDAGDQLLIRTVISYAGNPIDWSVSCALDRIKSGLPDFYSSSVLNGAIAADAANVLGSGCLVFNVAAHGEIGPCESMFTRLAGIVVCILQPKVQAMSPDELLKVVLNR